jgi:hypothetical protein
MCKQGRSLPKWSSYRGLTQKVGLTTNIRQVAVKSLIVKTFIVARKPLFVQRDLKIEKKIRQDCQKMFG